MMACTSPAFTVRLMPLRMFLPSTRGVEILDFEHDVLSRAYDALL